MMKIKGRSLRLSAVPHGISSGEAAVECCGYDQGAGSDPAF